MHARSFWTCAIAALALAASPIAARAQDFPIRPITLIVGWPAGGPTDIVCRALADAASKHLGHAVIVDNKAGGSGAVGPAAMAASAKPDGYTIAHIPITVLRLPLMQATTWSASDFTYIIHLMGSVFTMIASADSPFRSWRDVIDYARANPGKATYGVSSGIGGSQHLGVEQIALREGVKLTPIPFKGASELYAAVAGGHVMIGATGTGAKPLVDAGKARFLNVWTAERVKILPDVPTLRELGYPLVINSPWGLAGPRGMDPRVVARLHDAFSKALADPAVQEMLTRFEMIPDYRPTDGYVQFVAELIEKERDVLGRLGLLKK